MKRSSRAILIFVVGILFLTTSQNLQSEANEKNTNSDDYLTIYNFLSPDNSKPSFKVFELGMKGRMNLLNEGRLKNQKYLTLIDYSLPSTQKRLWVIDCDSFKVVQNSLVAHGRKTGDNRALRFSNRPHSNMSSLGFFLTGETYYGKHGLSLRLDGLEPGINDKARRRAIVIHGAPYASRQFINKYGRLGRSLGCPTLPPDKNKTIIQYIKNQSCVFIYFPEKKYFSLSRYFSHSTS